MKITITSTDVITRIDGVPVRLWEGRTEGGLAVKVFVHRLAVKADEDCAQFDRELREQAPPGRHIPLSMIL